MWKRSGRKLLHLVTLLALPPLLLIALLLAGSAPLVDGVTHAFVLKVAPRAQL